MICMNRENDKKDCAGGKHLKWGWPPVSYNPRLAIDRYLEGGGSLTPRGREGVIAECEDELCRRFEQRRAVLMGSGTMALYAAFFAVGLEPGDEIVCPTVTFHATASPALHFGARVVLVDVDPETGCIQPGAAAAAITGRTKAIVTNAQWGHPVDQEEIERLCERHGLAWVEDISHAHGAAWRGRQVGTWGHLACASLGAEKMLTGGMGGVLMGRRDDLVDRAVLCSHYLFRSRTDVRTPGYEGLARTGYGLKLGIHPLAAVVVLDQLQNHFDEWLAQRSESLMRLREGLSGIAGLVPPVVRPGVTSMGAWYGFKPWLDFASLGLSRADFLRQLKDRGVEADEPGSPPLHELALFQAGKYAVGVWPKPELNPAGFPGAARYGAGTVSLPTYTMPEDRPLLERTIEAFREVLQT